MHREIYKFYSDLAYIHTRVHFIHTNSIIVRTENIIPSNIVRNA